MIDIQFDKPSDFLAWSIDQDLGDPEKNAVFQRYYHATRDRFGARQRGKYDFQVGDLTACVRSGEIKRVLDVGCGCGSLAIWLTLNGASALGLDVKEERVEVARRRVALLAEQAGRPLPAEFRSVSVFDVTAESDPPFDAVWLEQAFHHIEPREVLYNHMATLLRPGGLIYVSESNGWNPGLQALLLKQRGLKTVKTISGPNGEVIPYGDERITTPGAMKRGFAAAGVKKIRSVYFGAALPGLEGLPQLIAPIFCHYLWIGRKEPAQIG